MFRLFKKKEEVIQPVKYISINTFPKQGVLFRKQVDVYFEVGSPESIRGVVVRDDIEAPHITIVRLMNGRHVLGSECALLTVVH